MGNTPTPLRRAIRNTELEKVREILDKAGDDAPSLINDDYAPDCIMESCTRTIGNAFYYAVARGPGREDIVQLLIDRGADIHSTGYFGESTLHCAARENAIRVAKMLVAAGCDVHATDDSGRLPIHSSARTWYNTSAMVQYLLDEAGSRDDINVLDYNNWTPLHEAASVGNLQVATTLLAYGADVNAQSKQGNTPLHVASKFPKMVKLLKEHGAIEHPETSEGKTANETV